MAKHKKIVGRTPNGGAYFEIYFFDTNRGIPGGAVAIIRNRKWPLNIVGFLY